MTTGKIIALTKWNFVGKVMSLFFNMPSRFVIVFLPRSKHLLISWLQSLSAVILEPKKIKSVTVSIVSPSIWHEVINRTFLVAQTVKCLPTMQETWVQSLGREDLLEKAMATHSNTLAWKIPWAEKPGRLQSMGSLAVGHD